MPILQSEEIHRRTDLILRGISEQFNPNLRNFLQTGKAYEKSLAAVSVTSKAFFDSIDKMGILAVDSMSAKDLGESMRQIAETFRQIQEDYDDSVKLLTAEIVASLESRLDHDTRYIVGLQKKYVTDYRLRSEDLERLSVNQKKLKKRTGSGKKSVKTDDKEKQLAESIALKQKSLDQFQHDSLKQACIEERRRFCFFAEQQCGLVKHSVGYHRKSLESLSSQLPKWTETCAGARTLPNSASALLEMSKPDEEHYSINSIPDPPSEPAVGPRNGMEHGNTMPARHMNEQNYLPPGVQVQDGNQTMPRPNSAGHNIIPKENRKRVTTLFSHSVPGNSAQLSFEQGDIIILLIPQPRDGWHYGENSRTKQRGWFPYSYTKQMETPNNTPERGPAELVTGQMPLPPADYYSSTTKQKNSSNWSSPPADTGFDPYKLMKDQFLMGRSIAHGTPNSKGTADAFYY